MRSTTWRALLVHGRFGPHQHATKACAHSARVFSPARASCRIAIENPKPNRIRFNLMRVMQSNYKIDTFQETYFVIDSFRTCSTPPRLFRAIITRRCVHCRRWRRTRQSRDTLIKV